MSVGFFYHQVLDASHFVFALMAVTAMTAEPPASVTTAVVVVVNPGRIHFLFTDVHLAMPVDPHRESCGVLMCSLCDTLDRVYLGVRVVGLREAKRVRRMGVE
jgi:hypothetical protein